MKERHRVLVVDDEHDVLHGVGFALRGQGFELAFAVGAAAALAQLEREPADLVISDYRMAGMDGLQLLEEVRRRWPDTARLLLTGHATLELAMEALNRGLVFKLLLKPSEPGDLQVAAFAALEQREADRRDRRVLDQVLAHPKLRARLEELAQERAAASRLAGAGESPPEGPAPGPSGGPAQG